MGHAGAEPLNAELVRLFIEAGLLQFGRFQTPSGTRPFLVNLDYLPAYPDILKQIAAEARSYLDALTVHRLVATADAVPFGVALALETGISLVYSRGQGKEAVYDLAGAYNIGHASVLLVNATETLLSLDGFIAGARRVGLDIHTAVAIFDPGTTAPKADVTARAMINLPAALEILAAQGELPIQQASTVRAWIAEQRAAATPHPGAAKP
jgi:orotate phosphoribosyltransferase